MPTVTVIIPCYNRAHLVGETIANMLDQSLPPTEIIVVDDGSTDGSADVIASFGSKVTFLRQSNQGPGAARNAGLKAAKGEFIQFMDSDDLASHNKLEVQVKALQETGADFAYGPWVRCLIEKNQIRFLANVLQTRPTPSSKNMLEWFISGWSLVFQNCLFRRSILDRAGWYRTDLMPSEDSEYFMRILLSGALAVHTPDILVFYREHTTNKITAGGTSAKHRACDWTRFLEITGGYLCGLIPKMKASTRIALAASVRSHLIYCERNNLPGLSVGHPYNNLVLKFKSVAKLYSFYTRLRRKLMNTGDHHAAFYSSRPRQRHKKLVLEVGYKMMN